MLMLYNNIKTDHCDDQTLHQQNHVRTNLILQSAYRRLGGKRLQLGSAPKKVTTRLCASFFLWCLI